MEKNTTQRAKGKGSGEIITIGIGSSGVESTVKFFNDIAIEHDIIKTSKNLMTFPDNFKYLDFSSKFFYERSSGKLNTRSILFDFNNSFLSGIESRPYGSLINKQSVLNINQESNHRFSMKYNDNNKDKVEEIIEKIREESEKCEKLDGFIINSQFCGGVSSGITCSVLEQISVNYGRKNKISNSPYTNLKNLKGNEQINCCYNGVFSVHTLVEHVDVVNFYDNQKLAKLGEGDLNIAMSNPEIKIQNQVLGKLLTDFTSCMRFSTYKGYNLNKINNFLCPYPRIHFNAVNYGYQNDETEACFQVFNPKSDLSGCDYTKGKFLSAFATFRGMFNENKLEAYISKKIKDKKIEFVDFNPQNYFNNSHCQVSDIYGNLSAQLLIQNTSVTDIFNAFTEEFDSNFSNRKLVSDYVGDGLEEGEFTEAREDIAALILDYKEVGTETQEEGEE